MHLMQPWWNIPCRDWVGFRVVLLLCCHAELWLWACGVFCSDSVIKVVAPCFQAFLGLAFS